MKLLISDLDGTLLEKDHSISHEVFELVKKIENLGVLFSIATGRALSAAKDYIEKLNLTTPVILFNGARIYDPVQNKYIVQYFLSKKAVELALKVINSNRNLTAAFFVNEEVYMYNVGPNAATYLIRDALTYRSVDDLRFVENLNITKIVFASYPYNLSKLEIELPEFFEQQADVVRSEDDLLEILPRSINKGSALKKLCELLKITLDEVIAMGDSMNDFQMIKTSGIGIAVGKASDELKKAAKFYFQTGKDALQKVYEMLERG